MGLFYHYLFLFFPSFPLSLSLYVCVCVCVHLPSPWSMFLVGPWEVDLVFGQLRCILSFSGLEDIPTLILA